MEENIQIRKELLASVENLSDEQLNRKLDNENWTIMQVLEHLYLMESKLVKLMNHFLVKAEEELIPEKPIHLAINRTQRVMSPERFEPADQFIPLDEMKQKLNESRATLFEFVEQTKNINLSKKGFPHPLFGQISIKQWIPLIGYHEKRHLEQIEELKRKITN